MEINLAELNHEQITELLGNMLKDILLTEGEEAAAMVFFTVQDFISKLAAVNKFITSFDLNLMNGYDVKIAYTLTQPVDWDFSFIRDFLRESFDSLKDKGLIIYGFNLEYNRPYAHLYVGFLAGEKSMCIDFRKADIAYD